LPLAAISHPVTVRDQVAVSSADPSVIDSLELLDNFEQRRLQAVDFLSR